MNEETVWIWNNLQTSERGIYNDGYGLLFAKSAFTISPKHFSYTKLKDASSHILNSVLAIRHLDNEQIQEALS